MNAEWRQIVTTKLVPMYRTGWLGVYDALAAAITKDQRRTVPTAMTISIWVLTDAENVRIDIANASFVNG